MKELLKKMFGLKMPSKAMAKEIGKWLEKGEQYMNIEIMDWSNKRTNIKIKDFDNVVKIAIKVVTGDEIMTILYKNYDIETYDSSSTRLSDFFDDEYVIYDITKNINYIDSWSKRNSSYDYELKK